jgi:hypothetical protein
MFGGGYYLMSNDGYNPPCEEEVEAVDVECKYCKSKLNDKEQLKSEDLAIWYLRLNGFFTIKNFVVHPEKGPSQKTEIDALAIRLPHRAEGLTDDDEMVDDSIILSISNDDKNPLLLIAEVKKGKCEINETWENREKENMERFLKAIGCTPKENNQIVADALYDVGIHRGDYTISLICFGKEKNIELKRNKPEITQILWNDVLGFIYDRFKKYTIRKSSHKQWDDTGHKLWDLCRIYNDRECFIVSAKKMIK